MSNDRLIDEMTCNLTPVRRPTPLVDGAIHISVGIAELLPFLALGFMRRDIPKVPHIPSFWRKLVSLGLLAITCATAAVLSLDRIQPRRRTLHGVSP